MKLDLGSHEELVQEDEKLIQGMDKKIKKVLKDLEDDYNFDSITTENKINIEIKDDKGEIRKRFVIIKKIKIPVGSEMYDIEKFLEARIRFPDDEPAKAIEKLEELKESQKGG